MYNKCFKCSTSIKITSLKHVKEESGSSTSEEISFSLNDA